MSRDTLVRALAEPGLQSSFCPSPHTHTLRDCARLRVPLHPPSSDVHLASHLLGGKIHALEQTASLPLFSLPHFPRQGLCTCRLPPGCTPPLLFLRSLGCCPHHVAETASLKVSLFPNTDFFFCRPHPAAKSFCPGSRPLFAAFSAAISLLILFLFLHHSFSSSDAPSLFSGMFCEAPCLSSQRICFRIPQGTPPRHSSSSPGSLDAQ